MNLIFSQAQRAIDGKSYSNRYFFWATHTAPPTAQLHQCKNPAQVCPNKGCKVATMCDTFSSHCLYFRSFSVSGLSWKTRLTYLRACSRSKVVGNSACRQECHEPHARQTLVNKRAPKTLLWIRTGDIRAGDLQHFAAKQCYFNIFPRTTVTPEALPGTKQAWRIFFFFCQS